METTEVLIKNRHDEPIPNRKGWIWGNNAGWHCVDCEKFCASRTSNSEYRLECTCGLHYEILREENKNLKRTLGIRCNKDRV